MPVPACPPVGPALQREPKEARSRESRCGVESWFLPVLKLPPLHDLKLLAQGGDGLPAPVACQWITDSMPNAELSKVLRMVLVGCLPVPLSRMQVVGKAILYCCVQCASMFAHPCISKDMLEEECDLLIDMQAFFPSGVKTTVRALHVERWTNFPNCRFQCSTLAHWRAV